MTLDVLRISFSLLFVFIILRFLSFRFLTFFSTVFAHFFAFFFAFSIFFFIVWRILRKDEFPDKASQKAIFMFSFTFSVSIALLTVIKALISFFLLFLFIFSKSFMKERRDKLFTLICSVFLRCLMIMRKKKDVKTKFNYSILYYVVSTRRSAARKLVSSDRWWLWNRHCRNKLTVCWVLRRARHILTSSISNFILLCWVVWIRREWVFQFRSLQFDEELNHILFLCYCSCI